MNSKHLIYKDEINDLWEIGHGYTKISEIIIDRHRLKISPDHFRKTIKHIVKYNVADKQIVE